MARIGKYVVTGELGRGERSVVSSALDPGIGRPVAIKLLDKKALPPDGARSVVERFRRQAQAAGMLHHPNVIAIYEYDEDAGQAWIAMEIVHGRSLRTHLDSGYRPAPNELPELVVQLLEALDFSHAYGVVHGDLRAENVLVSQNGAPKLGNYGGRPANEAADLQAAVALLREVLKEQPVFEAALAETPQSVRALLDALRSAVRPKGISANVEALRRGVKAPPAGNVAVRAPKRLPSVLFVDDEERVTNALQALFDGIYDVSTASSGVQALELMKARRFHAVVSDQRMPGMTGVELLREAKEAAPHALRLLLTGYSDLGAIVGSVNDSEVFRFISKPWEQQELQATLAEAVDVAIAREAAAAGGRRTLKTDAAVLVAGDPAVARGVRELAGGSYKVLDAAGAEAAAELLARETVGVIVCDVQAGAATSALLREVRRTARHTQVVALSEHADADTTIRLINEVGIHRLLSKPANFSLLHGALASALARYAELAAVPAVSSATAA